MFLVFLFRVSLDTLTQHMGFWKTDVTEDETTIIIWSAIKVIHVFERWCQRDCYANDPNHSFSDEEISFEARDIKIRNGQWISEEYDVMDKLLGRYVNINIGDKNFIARDIFY